MRQDILCQDPHSRSEVGSARPLYPRRYLLPSSSQVSAVFVVVFGQTRRQLMTLMPARWGYDCTSVRSSTGLLQLETACVRHHREVPLSRTTNRMST
ncbi:hypothetical protein KEM60_00929 [Austwickia sp. TVS 96-490-7B]|nr:hypothetical protein [Austwickia sp. TVS 96-490-7B]